LITDEVTKTESGSAAQLDLETGYIDHKVDFVENLSEENSNSWCEEASQASQD
jgi:hypothetical protein